MTNDITEKTLKVLAKVVKKIAFLGAKLIRVASTKKLGILTLVGALGVLIGAVTGGPVGATAIAAIMAEYEALLAAIVIGAVFTGRHGALAVIGAAGVVGGLFGAIAGAIAGAELLAGYAVLLEAVLLGPIAMGAAVLGTMLVAVAVAVVAKARALARGLLKASALICMGAGATVGAGAVGLMFGTVAGGFILGAISGGFIVGVIPVVAFIINKNVIKKVIKSPKAFKDWLFSFNIFSSVEPANPPLLQEQNIVDATPVDATLVDATLVDATPVDATLVDAMPVDATLVAPRTF